MTATRVQPKPGQGTTQPCSATEQKKKPCLPRYTSTNRIPNNQEQQQRYIICVCEGRGKRVDGGRGRGGGSTQANNVGEINPYAGHQGNPQVPTEECHPYPSNST